MGPAKTIRVVTSSADKTLCCWELTQGERRDDSHLTGADSSLLSGGDAGARWTAVHMPEAEKLVHGDGDRGVSSLAVCGDMVVSGSYDQTVRVWCGVHSPVWWQRTWVREDDRPSDVRCDYCTNSFLRSPSAPSCAGRPGPDLWRLPAGPGGWRGPSNPRRTPAARLEHRRTLGTRSLWC